VTADNLDVDSWFSSRHGAARYVDVEAGDEVGEETGVRGVATGSVGFVRGQQDQRLAAAADTMWVPRLSAAPLSAGTSRCGACSCLCVALVSWPGGRTAV
jgi:hypothetical protein